MLNTPKVLFENTDFLVLDKPAGLLVHGTKASGKELIANNEEKTLVDWLLENRPEIKGVGDEPETRPGIVHRLDKDTSGVIIIAKNQKSFEYLKDLFQKHEVKKTYLAIVFGMVKDEEGRIEKPIGIKSGTIKRSVRSEKMVKEAITDYKVRQDLVIKNLPYTVLEVSPKTGRTHQIRVHLASIYHPILGDALYGGRLVTKNRHPIIKRQALHSESIEFNLENGERIKILAELPEDILKVLKMGEKK